MYTEYLLHCSSLKTNRTPKHDLPSARKRGVAPWGENG